MKPSMFVSPLMILKKKTDFAWNPHYQRHSAKGVFRIYHPVAGVNFPNNISISLVRVNIRETEHDTTFEFFYVFTVKINPSIVL